MEKYIRLSNDVLEITLHPTLPIVHEYYHLPSQQTFVGASDAGCLAINREVIPWNCWETTVEQTNNMIVYQTYLSENDVTLEWHFEIDNAELHLHCKVINDPKEHLNYLEWVDLPLLVCPNEGFETWRAYFKASDPKAMNKMWATDIISKVEHLPVEASAQALIYGAFWNGSICAFIDSDYPLLPLKHQKLMNGTIALTLNTWQVRVRTQKIATIKVTVGFLNDLNGDGCVDLCDYRLWVNRSRPAGDHLYADAIIYKIFTHHKSVGLATNLEECNQIIRAIHNITDGLPQIVYLIGQQEGGHDGTYPTLAGGINLSVGRETQLKVLHTLCREELNTVLSYHANLDDAYQHSRDWDERFVVPDTSAEVGSLQVQGSICHTRDVEIKAIFNRLQDFLDTFPTNSTLHLDNLRLTNTVNRKGWEDIGVLEELMCGLQPIVRWLKKRGITLTTEGYNGLPIDPSLLVSGFWHHDPPDRMRQLLHRRIYGGGRGDHLGRYTTADYGICNNFHIDLSYRRCPPKNLPENIRQRDFGWLTTPTLTWSLQEDWRKIVNCLYLGTLLSHFYNEYEMVSWKEMGSGWTITYEDNIKAEVCLDGPESLKVTMGDIVIARDNDRFVPRNGAIYAFSRDGSNDTWTLPPALRNRQLDLYTLHDTGRGPAPDFEINNNSIQLNLKPGVPVKVVPS
ncbi:MAG: endo-alpha-N-acetylgalactosaminidase family protein [Candidatus Latescibacterota bacterium]|nr:endo-alpha-N-acetylgalactosaminidase family protein [Candidatus Latescibacterota bacterium]